MSNAPAIQRRLETIVERQQVLLTSFTDAIGSSDVARQGEIQKELVRLQAEMRRLTDELRFAERDERGSGPKPRSRAPGKTLREFVLDIVDEVGVPLSPATISEF